MSLWKGLREARVIGSLKGLDGLHFPGYGGRGYNSRMQSSRMRGIARAYLLSIAFWCGISLLMGLQYQPIDYRHFWYSLGNLLPHVAAHAAALALWTPPIFYLVARFLPYSKKRVRYAFL